VIFAQSQCKAFASKLLAVRSYANWKLEYPDLLLLLFGFPPFGIGLSPALTPWINPSG
jgi:hypothetical protein